MFTILLQAVYAGLLLITPLIMSSATSELFEFNKMLIIYLGAILVVFFWGLEMIVHKKLIFKKTLLDIPIAVFLISQLLSTIFSIDVHTSLFGYYGRFNGGLISIIAYLILFYGFVSHADHRFVQRLLTFSLIASFGVILWGLPGHFGYDLSCFVFLGQLNNACWTDQFRPAERLFSTLGQPNWLGAYLAVNFFIGLYFLFRQNSAGKDIRSKLPIALIYVYLFFNFTTLLFTRSRSALASVLTGVFIFVGYALYAKRKMLKEFNFGSKIVLFLALVLVCVLVFKTGITKIDIVLRPWSLVNPSRGPVASPKTPPSGVTESLDIRKIVWKGAVDLGMKYPFFGSGVETFAYAYYFVRPLEHNMTSEWDYLYNKAHNEYLNYFATTGFFGILAYLILIAASLFLFLRFIKQERRPFSPTLFLLLAYLTILITNFFGFSTSTINLFFYLLPAVSIVLSTRSEKPDDKELKSLKVPRSFGVSQGLTATTLSVGALFCLFFLYNYFRSDVLYAQADAESKGGNYQQAAQLTDRALRLHYEHVYQDKLSYLLANLAFIASYEKQSELAGQLMRLSDAYNKQTLAASPKNVLYWKTRAKNDYLFYQVTLNKSYIQNAIDALEEAKKNSPTDAKISYSEALMYSLYGDELKEDAEKVKYKNRAFQEIDRSIGLKPNYRDSYFLKGQLLKKYGKKDEAKRVFEFILSSINSADTEAKKELESL